MRRGLNIVDIGTYLALGTAALFTSGPILWMVITSLKSEAEIVTRQFKYFPSHPELSNYSRMWTQSGYPSLLWNSLVVTMLTLAICICAGSLAAYALSRFDFPGRMLVLNTVIRTRMFPVVLMLAPLFMVLKSFGLVDTKLGLALAYSAVLLPSFIWILKAFIDRVPRELDKAAMLDGASPIASMSRVVLPLAVPGLVAAGLFTAAGAWNEFLFALMFTTSTGSRTWPVGLQLMVGDFQLPWGMIAAGGVLSTLPVLAMFIVGRRLLARVLAVDTGSGL